MYLSYFYWFLLNILYAVLADMGATCHFWFADWLACRLGSRPSILSPVKD